AASRATRSFRRARRTPSCILLLLHFQPLSLDTVLPQIRVQKNRGQRKAKHFLLQGFFSHEKSLMQSLKQYYLCECGIQLIPFLRDQRDWDQLLDVLKEFARLAPASAPMYLQEFKEMGELLNG
ncbi:MAG: hypothetical protein K8F53_10290, partial [Rhodocyclaceae bacterium]|nr:hypothetical protein [Rhodocyclaceae bacterium]